MFGKVFKHEMRATVLPYSIIFAICVFFGICTFFTGVPYEITQIHSLMRYKEGGMAIIISLCSMVAVLIPILYFILTWIRYSKSMYGREGYLSHSLPVSSVSLVLGKFASSAVWGVCVYLISVFLVCSVLYNTALPIYIASGNTLTEFWAQIGNMWEDASLRDFLLSIFFSSLLHISLFSHYIFLSVTLANLPCFRKGSTILSIVFFFLIQYIEGRLMTWVLRDEVEHFVAENVVHWFSALTDVFSVENLWYVALAVVHLVITIWLVKKHTALQ